MREISSSAFLFESLLSFDNFFSYYINNETSANHFDGRRRDGRQRSLPEWRRLLVSSATIQPNLIPLSLTNDMVAQGVQKGITCLSRGAHKQQIWEVISRKILNLS